MSDFKKDRSAYKAEWFQRNKDAVRQRVQARHRHRMETEPEYREAHYAYARAYQAKKRATAK